MAAPLPVGGGRTGGDGGRGGRLSPLKLDVACGCKGSAKWKFAKVCPVLLLLEGKVVLPPLLRLQQSLDR